LRAGFAARLTFARLRIFTRHFDGVCIGGGALRPQLLDPGRDRRPSGQIVGRALDVVGAVGQPVVGRDGVIELGGCVDSG
jgi:hypothetical protein